MTNPDHESPDTDPIPPSSFFNRELLDALRAPSANVSLPPESEMTVRLVPEHLLREMTEIENDGLLSSNLFSISLGAILGFVTNVVTAADFTWTNASSAVIAGFGVACALTGANHLRLRRRLRARQRRLLPMDAG